MGQTEPEAITKYVNLFLFFKIGVLETYVKYLKAREAFKYTHEAMIHFIIN